jgi:hypothetical protein
MLPLAASSSRRLGAGDDGRNQPKSSSNAWRKLCASGSTS